MDFNKIYGKSGFFWVGGAGGIKINVWVNELRTQSQNPLP